MLLFGNIDHCILQPSGIGGRGMRTTIVEMAERAGLGSAAPYVPPDVWDAVAESCPRYVEPEVIVGYTVSTERVSGGN